MDWLQDLLWNPNSVAHIVFLYAFVVAAGVYLGKIKIFGVSLGVTFVLFAGILMGHSVSVFRWGLLSSLHLRKAE